MSNIAREPFGVLQGHEPVKLAPDYQSGLAYWGNLSFKLPGLVLCKTRWQCPPIARAQGQLETSIHQFGSDCGGIALHIAQTRFNDPARQDIGHQSTEHRNLRELETKRNRSGCGGVPGSVYQYQLADAF
jgi:hypothetical protein